MSEEIQTKEKIEEKLDALWHKNIIDTKKSHPAYWLGWIEALEWVLKINKC